MKIPVPELIVASLMSLAMVSMESGSVAGMIGTSAKAGGDLSKECAIAFRMVRRPFEDPDFIVEIRDLTETLLMRSWPV